MPNSSTQLIFFIIVISTFLILLFGSIIIRYIFLYQRRRFRHEQEMLEMRETFTQTLLESKLKIQEDTLKHIAEELHANASHQASLINIHLTEMLEKGSPEMRESIYEIKLIAKQLMGDLKALSAGLNTNHIMKIGFIKALENELNRLSKTKKYTTHFNKSGEEFPLRMDNEIILFRMCQEILNNVVKYSEAKSVAVSLNYLPTLFQLEISDDGIGFNIEDALKNSGEKESTGLMNMQNRAKLIDAKLEMYSKKDNGTRFIVSIPIKQNQI
jgi:signal transduction histidine kinase